MIHFFPKEFNNFFLQNGKNKNSVIILLEDITSPFATQFKEELMTIKLVTTMTKKRKQNKSKLPLTRRAHDVI